MPFVEREEQAIWNDPSLTQQTKASMMYDASSYCQMRGNGDVWYIKALRPFAFPNDLQFPFLNWVKYTAATQKSNERWTILQPELCDKLQRHYHLHCINGAFFCDEGYISDDAIRSIVTKWIIPFLDTNIARTVTKVLEALRSICYTKVPVPDRRKIYTHGGYTLTLQDDGSFTKEYQPDALTVTRLPVRYDKDAPKPQKFLYFLHGLLNDDDIVAVQEYVGYMLIPTTAAQKALFLRCAGGTGKSVLLDTLSRLFGKTAAAGQLIQLATDRFTLATLENKLVFIDDDMTTNAIHDTGLIKTIITAGKAMQAERKGKDKYEFTPFARLICAGNKFPSAVFDMSNGLYRRLLLIECKQKPHDRVDDKLLTQKIVADELPGILLWALQGLCRLHRNGYELYQSDASKQIVREKMLDENPVLRFMQDDGWVVYDPTCVISTKKLLKAFELWAADNAVSLPAQRIVTVGMSQYAKQHNLKDSENVMEDGRRGRGYIGISLTGYARKIIDEAEVRNRQWQYASLRHG